MGKKRGGGRNFQGGGGGSDQFLQLKGLVQEILEEKQKTSKYTSEDEVVEILQERYPFYKRKTQQALKILVFRAMSQLKLEARWEQEERARNMEIDDSSTVPSPSAKQLDVATPSSSALQDGTSPSSAVSDQQVPPPATPAKRKASETDAATSDEKIVKKKKRLSSSSDSRSADSSPLFQPTEIPQAGFEMIGGMKDIIEQVKQTVEWPFLYPELFVELGARPPMGLLLHGPTGCGKTLLANAIAAELSRQLGNQFTYFRVSAPELVSGMSGESESNIRNLFNVAKNLEPCLIFIDEIDVICPKRDSVSKEMERRIVAQLVTCFNDLRNTGNAPPKRITVIGATNRIDSLDPSLRVGGRFDKEIALKVPNDYARAEILKLHTQKMKLAPNFDFMSIARQTPGFVGADLIVLANEAASASIKRLVHELENAPKLATETTAQPLKEGDPAPRPQIPPSKLKEMFITMQDFEQAAKHVQPSAKREGFATIPNVKWSDVGALQDIRNELGMHVLRPIKEPWLFQRAGVLKPAGILLFGPPGCGKTLLAKAIANDCSSSFISVKGPELLNKYVGESERAVRKVFERAKHSLPCVIFFDELDALCPRRDEDGNAVTKRVVNQLLTEIDGLEDRDGIYIIAATNRPDIIDPAMLRPERLGKLIYVPLPDEPSRLQILQTLTQGRKLSPDVNLQQLAKRSVRFSGADLSELVREASVIAISKCKITEEDKDTQVVVTAKDYEQAFAKISPSVSEEEEQSYLQLRQTFQRS